MSTEVVVKLAKCIKDVGDALNNKPEFNLLPVDKDIFALCYEQYFTCVSRVAAHCIEHAPVFDYLSQVLADPARTSERRQEIVEKHLINNERSALMIQDIKAILISMLELNGNVKKLQLSFLDNPHYKNKKARRWLMLVLGSVGVVIGIILVAVPSAVAAIPLANPIVLDVVTSVALVSGGVAVGGAGAVNLINGLTEKVVDEEGLSSVVDFINGLDRGIHVLRTATDNHRQRVEIFHLYFGDGEFNSEKAAAMCRSFRVLTAAVEFAYQPNSSEESYNMAIAAALGVTAGAVVGATAGAVVGTTAGAVVGTTAGAVVGTAAAASLTNFLNETHE